MNTHLFPASDWQWQFEPDKEQLILHTSQHAPFVTAFKNKQLILNGAMQEPFTVEHTEAFHGFFDVLQRGFQGCLNSVPEPVLWHICIHAVAARFYHKAVANKSYWFTKSEAKQASHHLFDSELSPPVSQLAAFDTQYSAKSAESTTGCGLLLQTDGSFANVLLLSPLLPISEDKTLARYTALNTHINTLRDASMEELSTLF